MLEAIDKYEKEILAAIGVWLIGFVIILIDQLTTLDLFMLTVVVTIFGYVLKLSSSTARLEAKLDFVYKYVVDEINRKIKGGNE
jgi:hypothetical protein